MRSLAYADLYLCIASLIARFEFELVDTLRERDVDLSRDHFVAKATSESHGVRVKVVKEYGIEG